MEKFLILKGCAGLGNRLITLFKAMNYANKSNRSLYVDWSDGMFAEKGSNVFYKYFMLDGVKYTQDISGIKSCISQGASTYPQTLELGMLDNSIYDDWHVTGGWIAKYPIYRIIMSFLFKGKISSILGLQSWQMNTDKSNGYFHRIRNVFNNTNFLLGGQLTIDKESTVVLFVDFRPFVKTKYIFDNIKLKEKYINSFLQFADKYNLRNIGIGVHIRATDKKPSSKIEKLQKKIDMLLKQDDNRIIFLSTDNNQLKQKWETKYNGRMITYPKYLPEDLNGRGIHHWALEQNIPNIKERMFEESLADMWILSMCKHLFWQGNSSFSLMSSILKNDKENVQNWLKL